MGLGEDEPKLPPGGYIDGGEGLWTHEVQIKVTAVGFWTRLVWRTLTIRKEAEIISSKIQTGVIIL